MRFVDRPPRVFGPSGSKAPRGVTLVELLVVITLILIVTAATIPVVAPSIQQRRVREASRLVNSYIAAARSRALETGRPVGVVIQRFNPGLASGTVNANQSAQLFSMNLAVAESPPPYAGDTTNSLAEVYWSGGNNLFVVNFPSGDAWWNQKIRPGDRIRLNYQGPYYTIQPSNSSQLDAYGCFSSSTPPTPTNSSSFWILTPISPSSAPLPVGMVTYPQSYTSLQQPPAPPSPPQTPLGVFLPYEIYRQPFTSAAVAPLQLPEGIVIDMNYSGMSTEAANGQGVFINPGNQIISFAPSGIVDTLFDGTAMHPTGNIFLMLGRREQVGGLSGTTNLADPNSLWVSIGYQTGQVSTTENYANNGGVVATARGLATGSVGGPITTMGGR